MSHGQGGGIILRRSDGSAMTREEVIVMRRGYFKSLPVLFSNDLVHGSWWFFWGSLFSAGFAVIPLVQQYESFYRQHDDLLPAKDFVITWALLIVSGIFFAFGSLAFVRAFDEPPKRPLFYNFKHLQTDELLGAWLFLLGTAPSLPYSIVFFTVSPSVTYVGMIFLSILFCIGCILFVMACYPSDKETENYLLPLCLRAFGSRMWIVKHLANDWLAGTWFILWANVLVTVVSIMFFIAALAIGNSELIFIWLSGWVVSGLFLIGSVYFVAGSYPHANRFYYVTDKGERMESRAAPGKVSDPSAMGAGGHDTRKRRVSFDLETGKPRVGSSSSSSGSGIVAQKTMEYRQLDTVNPLHNEAGGEEESKETVASSDQGHMGGGASPHTTAGHGKEKKKKKEKAVKKDIGNMKSLLEAPATSVHVPLPPSLPSFDEEEEAFEDEDDDL